MKYKKVELVSILNHLLFSSCFQTILIPCSFVRQLKQDSISLQSFTWYCYHHQTFYYPNCEP
jgi:hypothetical protein